MLDCNRYAYSRRGKAQRNTIFLCPAELHTYRSHLVLHYILKFLVGASEILVIFLSSLEPSRVANILVITSSNTSKTVQVAASSAWPLNFQTSVFFACASSMFQARCRTSTCEMTMPWCMHKLAENPWRMHMISFSHSTWLKSETWGLLGTRKMTTHRGTKRMETNETQSLAVKPTDALHTRFTSSVQRLNEIAGRSFRDLGDMFIVTETLKSSKYFGHHQLLNNEPIYRCIISNTRLNTARKLSVKISDVPWIRFDLNVAVDAP